MTPESPRPAPAVELRGLTKIFGSLKANDNISFDILHGSIHGVVGENGAGKSTVMKMLYGIYKPDAGEILVNGRSRRWNSPEDAINAGIGMVHQHFMLAGPYTALENILLGDEPCAKSTGWLPRALRPVATSGARLKLGGLMRKYGMDIKLDTPVENLPVGTQQRIEILKLLYRNADILILDEPTAVLAPQETMELFANLKKLRDEGKTIIIITHKLKEVMGFTDRVTVLRGGRVAGGRETAQTSADEIACLMVGRKISIETGGEKRNRSTGGSVLDIKNLSLLPRGGQSSRHRLKNISLNVKSGEIVGIAGVEGNGQSELLQAILHPHDKSCVSDGAVAIHASMGLIPEDRHKEGLLLERPLDENFLLGQQHRDIFYNRGFVRYPALRKSTREAMETYDVRPRRIEATAGELSGGNQQKLIIAREMDRIPGLVIAAQPTRGVDIGAIEFIHAELLRARDRGAGILLISSELDEIMNLSDRIIVLYEGEVAGTFTRDGYNEREIGLCMAGHQ
ncbi:MAG: heme ABC transporter ATP-binding protein [Bdellovibrionales bacterium RIFOXYD1_FULL_53_11]|nr:MAG: heme ABC transporter ATP-binding protein [Bdellovibrionales bacterium RIFOXYD1_FULL_53_11]